MVSVGHFCYLKKWLVGKRLYKIYIEMDPDSDRLNSRIRTKIVQIGNTGFKFSYMHYLTAGSSVSG
jgi:hypothetical protein